MRICSNHLLFLTVALAFPACSSSANTGDKVGDSSSGGTALASGGSKATTGGRSAAATRSAGGTSTTSGKASTGGTEQATTTGSQAVTGGKSSMGGADPTGGKSSVGGASAIGAAGAGGTQSGGTSAKATGGSSAATGGTTSAGTGFMPCPATPGAVCNVMPVGDSITEGCCRNPMGGYRIELFRQANTNKKSLTFVGTLTNGPATVDGKTFPQHHEGHGGWKISQIAGVVDNAIKSSKPHIVILKIGTNDINGNDDIANAPNRLASLIDQITKDAPDALLVVSAIIPTTTDSTNTRVQAYNTAIKGKAAAAATAGKHVVFVDNYQVFAQDTSYKTAYMADGLHPNDAGYALLGKSFYGVISALLPTAP